MSSNTFNDLSAGINHPIRDFHKDNEVNEGFVYTTSNGVPMPHPYEAQRIGQSGPLLLQDFHLVDLLSHFDRERIPERVVHAKGSGAHGVFKCTKSLEDITFADCFANEGLEVPVTVRFSTVGGESGSADTARDPRGFSVKLKTREGNMDWVFNNTPIFFLRDPAKFPRFIHTQKRDPQTHLGGGADSTMFWDYLSNNPESVHQVMWLMGDRGIPDGYRKMQGYSGHTFKMINKAGEWVYCQIHMLSQQGVEFLTQEKGTELAGSAPDYATQDLFEAIDKGDFPKWKCYVQTMTAQEAEKAKFNVFDLTKIWPHKDYPLREFGEMTLNRNPKNYFSEVEQVAFNPAHLVPGVEPSADPVLQSRLFSYPDAHRHRIGVNYQQLPVNQHIAGYNAGNFQRDGQMAFYNQGSRPNYISSIAPPTLKKRTVPLEKIHNEFIGDAIAFLSELQPVDFVQPRDLWQKVYASQPGAQDRMISNIAGHMSTCKHQHILQKQLAIFHEVDPDIATRLSKALGITEYPKGVQGLTFNGIRNGMAGVKFEDVNENGYSHGHMNGHPAESAAARAEYRKILNVPGVNMVRQNA